LNRQRRLKLALLSLLLFITVLSIWTPLGYQSTLTEYPLPWNPWKAPYGLKVDVNGMVWFTESKRGNAIARFNPITKTYTEFQIPTPGANSYDLDIDSSGKVWFTEFNTSKIGKLDPSTGQIAEFTIPTLKSNPFGIRVDGSGNVWFAEYQDRNLGGGNKIGELTASGSFVEYVIPDTNSATEYLAPDAKGKIWFAESALGGFISALDPQTGIVTRYMAPTPDNTPVGVLVDGQGFVWFTEYGVNKIARFNPSSGLFQEFPIPHSPSDPPNPWLLTQAPDGSIWFSGDQQFSSTGSGVAGRVDPNSGSITVYTLPRPPIPFAPENHPKGIGADRSGNIWVALWDTDYIAQLQFAPSLATGGSNSLISSGKSWTLTTTVASAGATTTGVTTSVEVASNQASTGTAWVTSLTTAETVTKSTVAWVSGTTLTVLPVASALSSGPGGDQQTTSTSFTPSLQTITLNSDGSTEYLAIATSQLWDSSSSIGASMAICRDGTRISGDMYSVGANTTHRHLASAVATDQPTVGSHTYSLCYKTDPSGTGFVSGTYIVVLPVSDATSSGPFGDQSSSTAVFNSSSAGFSVTGNGSQQFLFIATSQVWDSAESIGASMALCKDGTRVSGDMFSLGAVATHRHIAAAVALDTPTGNHAYSLCFKTDPGGTAFVSGTYLVAVPVQSALSSGPRGDQSTTSTYFISSLEAVTVNPSTSQQYLLLASSQLWDSSQLIGSSLAVCRAGSSISSDLYAAGAMPPHRDIALAIALDTVGLGSQQYSLCFKTAMGF
jgi:virginiamycin B lyase